MKKIVLATIVATTLGMADFIGGEVDIGYYNHSPSGTAQNGDDIIDIESDLKWEDESDIFIKAYLEHPVPIIPNIKIGYSSFAHEGDGAVSKKFSWNDLSFNFKDRIHTKLNLDVYDITLYYELLDNWLNLDAGVNIKYLDGSIEVETTTKHENTSIALPIPMLYAKARVDVPTTDLSFQLEGNYVTYDGNTLYDLELGARYSFMLGFGIEAGYKAFKLKIDDVEDMSMDADFNGLYGKVVWDF